MLVEIVLLLLVMALNGAFGYFLAEARSASVKNIICVILFAILGGIVSPIVRETLESYDSHAIFGMITYISFMTGFVISKRKMHEAKQWSNTLIFGLLGTLTFLAGLLQYVH